MPQVEAVIYLSLDRYHGRPLPVFHTTLSEKFFMQAFTTMSGNSSVSGARLTQVVTQSLNGSVASLTTWEAFRDWIAQIFSCTAQRISYNSDIIGAFSGIVRAQVHIDQLENTAKRPVRLLLLPHLKTAYDQATVLQLAADENCPYEIEVTPAYINEYVKRQCVSVAQDFDSAIRLDSPVRIVIKRRDDDKVVFSLATSEYNHRFEMLTFPDPTTDNQRRIVIDINRSNERQFSMKTETVRL